MKVFTDQEAMALAVEEAKKGLGFVEPNPPVGCVILNKKRELLGSGYHHQFGKAHAEIDALKNLKLRDLKDAHIFVTLEPCAHFGKTPPCALALAKLPIATLTYGRRDPNPRVAGKGVRILKKAGIKTRILESAATLKLTDMFAYAFENKMAFVTLKIASTLDGQIALKSGESQWISGEDSRRLAHELRARHSAVLVGRHTLETDDPALNVRHPKFKNFRRENKIIIIDPQGLTLSRLNKYKVTQVRSRSSIIVVTSEKIKPNDKFCRHIAVKGTHDGLDLQDLKKELFALDIQSVLVEGGARTINQFITQRAANKLYVFMAPALVGAKNGLGWTPNLITKKLAHKIKLQPSAIEPVGDDFLLSYYFEGAL